MNDKTPTAEPGSALSELRDDAGSRKKFLRMAGGGVAGGLAVMLAACGDDDEDDSTSSGTTGEPTPESTPSEGGGGGMKGDLEILNYALTLEFLEADFYQQVIDANIIENRMVARLAQVVGQHEQEHVEALTAAIEGMGGTPVKAPATAFEDVLGGGVQMVLETAATVENLGAAAYLGQAGRIKNKEVLAAALAIHTVEARHAAALNQLVGRGFSGGDPLSGSIPDGAFAAPMDMDAVLEAVQPFLA